MGNAAARSRRPCIGDVRTEPPPQRRRSGARTGCVRIRRAELLQEVRADHDRDGILFDKELTLSGHNRPNWRIVNLQRRIPDHRRRHLDSPGEARRRVPPPTAAAGVGVTGSRRISRCGDDRRAAVFRAIRSGTPAAATIPDECPQNDRQSKSGTRATQSAARPVAPHYHHCGGVHTPAAVAVISLRRRCTEVLRSRLARGRRCDSICRSVGRPHRLPAWTTARCCLRPRAPAAYRHPHDAGIDSGRLRSAFGKRGPNGSRHSAGNAVARTSALHA